MPQNIKAHFYVFIATTLIAFSFIATAELSGSIDPISLTLYRFVLAFIILLPLMLIKFKELKLALKLVPGGLVVGLFYSAYFLAMFKALEVTSVLNTGTIYTLVPLMTALMCLYFCREKIAISQLFIYFLGLLATVIVIFKADINLLLNLELNYGDVIFFLGAFSMALYPIALKFLFPKDASGLAMVFATLTGGIVWLGLFLLFMDIPLNWEKVEGKLWFSMLYLSLGSTIITLFLYQKGIVILGPKKAMAYIYLSPAIVAVGSYFFYGTSINLGIALGILLAALATFLILKMPAEKL